MDFSKTYVVESLSLPGVVVTLKRMGPRLRAEVELSVSAARSKQRELSMRHEAARVKLMAAIAMSPKDADGKPIEAELRPECLEHAMELQAISDEVSHLVRAQIHPAFIKAGLKSFGGTEALTYEGNPATADLLIEWGPAELFDEIVAAINGNGYVSAESAKNLSLPTISAEQGDLEATNTTAPDVSSSGSTSSADAGPAIPKTS